MHLLGGAEQGRSQPRVELGTDLPFPDDLVTLPRESPLLQYVSSREVVMRRFNPDAADVRDIVSVDEGGKRRFTLKAGAFMGILEGGCSIGRKRILEKAAIPISDFLQPRYQAIGRVKVSRIRKFKHANFEGATANPFNVEADAYPDDQPFRRWQVAHALLTLNQGFTTPAVRKTALGALARTVFKVPQPYPEVNSP